MVNKSKCRSSISSTVISTKNWPRKKWDAIKRQIDSMSLINSPSLRFIHSLKCGKMTPNHNIKVALIRPLGTLKSTEEEKKAVQEMGEPHQLRLLASVLKNAGYIVRIFDQLESAFDPSIPDAYPRAKPNEVMIREVTNWGADVAMFSTFTYNFRQGLSIASGIKQKLEIPIIFGGYHATSVAEQYILFDAHFEVNPDAAVVFGTDLINMFQNQIIDVVCVGEGVVTVLDIMDALNGKKQLEHLTGIAFFNNGRVQVTRSERLNPDLYPLPYRPADFDPMMYYATGRGYPFLLMTTQTGCVNSCSFCSTGQNYPGVRFRSIDLTLKELIHIRDRFQGSWPVEKIMVNLTDEDFGVSSRRTIDLCNAIIHEGLDNVFRFNSFLAIRYILRKGAREMLTAMARAGFEFAFVGIESTLDDAIAAYGRPDKKLSDRMEQVQAAIDLMADCGIMFFGDMIGGFPGHDLDGLKYDYKRLLQLKNLLYVYFPILSPMPGTELYWNILLGSLGYGFLDEITYDDLDANRQVLKIRDGSPIQVARDQAVVDFFTRPQYEIDADAAVARDPKASVFLSRMLAKVSSDYSGDSRLGYLADKYSM